VARLGAEDLTMVRAERATSRASQAPGQRAGASPRGAARRGRALTAGVLRSLQRSVGNQAVVQRFKDDAEVATLVREIVPVLEKRFKELSSEGPPAPRLEGANALKVELLKVQAAAQEGGYATLRLARTLELAGYATEKLGGLVGGVDELIEHLKRKRITVAGKEYVVWKELATKDPIYFVYPASDRETRLVVKEVKSAETYAREKDLMLAVGGSEQVVQILAADDGSQRILMEYAQFGQLKDYLIANQLDETRKRQLVKDIVAGVSYIHGKGVTEGDIEERNIFVGGTTERPTAKIADFGEGSKDVDDAQKARGCFQSLSPIVQVVTNNKAKYPALGKQNMDGPAPVDYGCTPEAWAFLKKVRAFGDYYNQNQIGMAAMGYAEVSNEVVTSALNRFQALSQDAWLAS
jgi:hypothetical protein